MTKVRYLGAPVSNWYGRDLTPGQVLEVPAHLAHKAAGPLWEPVEPVATPEAPRGAPEPEARPEPPVRRRGRQRKYAQA